MMKSIHENILQFLDDEENKYDDALNDERIKIFQRNQFDKQELKSILYLISKISENHHRNSSFFEKINTIINLLKNQITQTFSNIEIFDYFKQNKMILLLLIKDNILTFDSNVSNRIEEIQYQPFFYTELNKLNVKLSEKENPENYENYEEKRFKGENDSYLCEIIRNDIIEEFTFYFTKGEFSLSDLIEPSIYESNAFLIGKRQSLIEYSAFFGSIQIFRFLIQNGVKLLPSLWLYSIHGRNPDMIHLLEENHVYPSDNTYQECLEESIKCHHNELAFYFINNFIDENDFHSNYKKNEIYYGFHYYNFEFIPIELKERFFFYYAIEHDYFKLFEYLLKNIEGLNINESINNIQRI